MFRGAAASAVAIKVKAGVMTSSTGPATIIAVASYIERARLAAQILNSAVEIPDLYNVSLKLSCDCFSSAAINSCTTG